jgi:hypothetical protein
VTDGHYFVDPSDAAKIEAAYAAFDAASWDCTRLDDSDWMDIPWMFEAMDACDVEDGYPRAYKFYSSVMEESGEALFFPVAERLGVSIGGATAEWGSAETVQLGVRQFLCDPAEFIAGTY